MLRVFRGSPFLNAKSKNSKLVTRLLDWFAKNARDLPWRRTRDPYAIWVSEIMLQQTQVKTVIPYWERWMRELPTIESLASASADKIHKLWEGLGYYPRVRNMQKAAQQIVASQSAVAADVSPLYLKAGRSQSRLTSAATIQGHKPQIARATLSPPNGESDRGRGFPTKFEDVLALPGIGRYTAGAICSIAFNQPTPILDGNVIRVLTRIHGIKSDPCEKQTNAQLWQLAAELVVHASRVTHHASANLRTRTRTKAEDDRTCSHLNQSLMELGALICTPRSPNCAACPGQALCIARKENLQERLPNLGKREAATERRFLAFVVERDGKFLVRQRPAGGVNAHLWEFPNAEIGARVCDPQQTGPRRQQSDNGNISSTELLRLTEPHSVAKDLGLRLASAKPLRVVKHSITRYRITLEAWRAEPVAARGTPVSNPARSKSTDRNRPGRPSSVALLRRVERPALQGQWRTPAELHQLAFTSAHKKILARLGAPIT